MMERLVAVPQRTNDPVLNILAMKADGVRSGHMLYMFDETKPDDYLKRYMYSVLTDNHRAIHGMEWGTNSDYIEWWRSSREIFKKISDETPFVPNSLAVAVNGGVMVQQHLRVRYAPYNWARDHGIIMLAPRCLDQISGDLVDDRFLEMKCDWRAFQGAVCALLIGNVRFFERPMLPPPVNYPTKEAHATAFETFQASLQPGDFLAMTTHSLPTAKAIRWLDNGRFSHGAIYIGNGQVQEAVPSRGTIRESLVAHRRRGISIWAYRHFRHQEMQLDRGLEALEATLGSRYNWRGVSQLGLSLLHDRLFGPWVDDLTGERRCFSSPLRDVTSGWFFFAGQV